MPSRAAGYENLLPNFWILNSLSLSLICSLDYSTAPKVAEDSVQLFQFQDLSGLEYVMHRVEEADSGPKQVPLQVVNAPWQVPDTNNMVDFPAMGGAGAGAPSANGVWGGQRRF